MDVDKAPNDGNKLEKNKMKKVSFHLLPFFL